MRLTKSNETDITLRYSGVNASPFWKELVQTQFKRLQRLAAIARAQVTLEWQREATPAYRVRAWLEVPGPDYHAAASDHTVEAALLKVVRNLERQIRLRCHNRAERRKAAGPSGLGLLRSSLARTACRA